MVGGTIVYGAKAFNELDENPVSPAMPDWSLVRKFGGYAAWGEPDGAGRHSLRRTAISTCGCSNSCGVHGHDHASAWGSHLQIADLKVFLAHWGALAGLCELALARSHKVSAFA